MPHYTFEGLSPRGDKVTGTLDAPTRRDAYRQIESRQHVPIHVTERTENPHPRNSSGDGAAT